MKVKLIQNYSHAENTRDYYAREEVEVMNKENSDFYYVIYPKAFDLIPKNICEVV